MTNSCKLNGDRDVNDYYGFTKDYDRTKDSQIKLKKNSDFGLKKKKNKFQKILDYSNFSCSSNIFFYVCNCSLYCVE